MAVKEGWRGRFYEDFEVSDVYEHPFGRTVTTTDNAWFTLLTQNIAPIHFDRHYVEQTKFGKPLVDFYVHGCSSNWPECHRCLSERLRQLRVV